MLSVFHFTSWANNVQQADTLAVEIYYWQGSSQLDFTYRHNQRQLDSLSGFLHKIFSNGKFRMEHIYIVSGASPEGSTALNKVLSKNRTRSVTDYLVRHIPAWQSSMVTESDIGIDWKKLREEVELSDMPYKEEVLHVLNNTPEWVVKDGIVVDGRKKQLKELYKGECWRYMEKHFFPKLRRSYIEVLYTSIPRPIMSGKFPEMDVKESKEAVLPSLVPETESHLKVTWAQPLQPFYMAVKTNLLYDALLVPDVGVEFYLSKGFSVGGNWMYAWWKNNGRHRYWRIYGGELVLRKYFGKPGGGSPLSGHHLGVYGQIFTYDFEIGGKVYMGGEPGGTLWEKMNYSTGLEYGYSLPIARRLNLDFVIGIGYWGGTCYEYLPVDNHYVWQQTRQRHWFGPTKAEVLLVWLLGRGNYNTKKGGRQ